MLILVAGVLMNVLLAFVIFTGIALLASPYVGLRFFEVQPDSPAATAGLQPGEAIVAVDGEHYQFITGPSALDGLRDRAGETVVLTLVDTDGSRRDVIGHAPAGRRDQRPAGRPRDLRRDQAVRGVLLRRVRPERPADRDPDRVASRRPRWMGLIVGGLRPLVSSVGHDPTAPPPVSGPVGIATQIGDIFWNSGPVMLLYVAGILSANLAVVNILPFPPLDGGRMLMITLKRIFGARISVRAEQLTYVVGFVFLFAFLIWVTGFDIIRGLGGG